MTERTETIDMDDKEMFDQAMAPEEPKQEERARDEKGRFVAAAKEEAQPEAKQPEPVAEQTPQEAAPPAEQPQEQQKEEANVPSWRLREVREAREAADRRAQEAEQRAWQLEQRFIQLSEQFKSQQPKPEPVDFFADPDKAITQHISPIEQKFEQRMQDMVLRLSRTQAIAQYGADKVAEMEKAVDSLIAQRHPDMAVLSQQMRHSDDPAGVAMKWYQRHQLEAETGGDITAYKNKVLEEAMKDPKFQAKVVELIKGQPAQAGKAPVVQLPPSLSKLPSGGSHAPDDGDVSDAALFKQALRGSK